MNLLCLDDEVDGLVVDGPAVDGLDVEVDVDGRLEVDGRVLKILGPSSVEVEDLGAVDGLDVEVDVDGRLEVDGRVLNILGPASVEVDGLGVDVNGGMGSSSSTVMLPISMSG